MVQKFQVLSFGAGCAILQFSASGAEHWFVAIQVEKKLGCSICRQNTLFHSIHYFSIAS